MRKKVDVEYGALRVEFGNDLVGWILNRMPFARALFANVTTVFGPIGGDAAHIINFNGDGLTLPISKRPTFFLKSATDAFAPSFVRV
ncbi:MAG: hypothetical protein KJ065_09415 [Anaerolineae bacterium]|nr:hypothetical protein [Anaerolineae bacterium]